MADITKFDIILMFLYIGSQFVASWQTARKGAGQQKIIAYMMPIMVGIFMFIGKWPAGLFIYWFTSNLWTIAQQYVAEKLKPMPVQAVIPSAKEKAPVRSSSAKTPAKTPVRTPVKPGAKPGTKAGAAPAKAKATTSTQPAKKSGGNTSGQGTSAKGQAAGSKSKRPDGGAGGPTSSS
jgi:YidC/Oxa1 family membrane protein insertase